MVEHSDDSGHTGRHVYGLYTFEGVECVYGISN